MALKTQVNDASVDAFIDAVDDLARREDSRRLVEMMSQATGEEPRMWGASIVGFGQYHYRYASGREGDWPIVGFSPRKSSFSVYIMPGFAQFGEILARLGKHKTSVSCLYFKRLSDLDVDALERLIGESVARMRELYPPESPPPEASMPDDTA